MAAKSSIARLARPLTALPTAQPALRQPWTGSAPLRSLRAVMEQRRGLTSSTAARKEGQMYAEQDFHDILSVDSPRPAIEVSSCSPSGFKLTDGLFLPSPAIFLNGSVFLWRVKWPVRDDEREWEGWTMDKLKIFEVVMPRPEILLFGTGSSIAFPPPSFKQYLNSLGIQVDVMDSRNACATYNLLASEGRRIAAAVVPPL